MKQQNLQVNLGSYTGIEIEKPTKPFTVSEEQVDRVIKSYQQHLAKRVEKPQDGVIEEGNLITFDFENWINGEPFPNSAVKDANVIIGSNKLMPGVEEGMIGLMRGPDQTLSFLMPAETHKLLSQLAKENYFGSKTKQVNDILAGLKVGQQIEVHFDIKNIEVLELPDLNDDFAKTLGFETLASLREQIKKDLVKRTEDDFLDQVMSQIIANSEFEIPEELVQQEVDNELATLVIELTRRGKTLAEYQQHLNFNSEEEFNQELRRQSTYNLKTQLVSLEIVHQEQIKVSEMEIEDLYQEISQHEHLDLETVHQQIDKEQIHNQLITNKLIKFLIENNG